MPREISDDEWYRIQSEINRLQSRAQVADFVESIYNDPQLGSEARALIKKKYPQIQIPEHDLRTEFNQKLDEERKAREKIEEDKRKAEQEQQWFSERKNVQSEFGLTDDGVKDLEKYMVDNQIGNYRVAAEHHAMKNPKQSDAHHHDGFWHHTKSDGFAEIAKDPEGWAYEQIHGAAIRDQERAKGGR